MKSASNKGRERDEEYDRRDTNKKTKSGKDNRIV
jgi:hypothetical protein